MLGEGGEPLQELNQATALLMQAALDIPADEQRLLDFLAAFRAGLNRCELAFSVAAAKLTPIYQRGPEMDLSPTQHLRYECHMAAGAAASAVQVGERLDELPLSRAAVLEGRIGFAHLNLIAYTAAFIGEGFDEAALLRHAVRCHVTAFARFCRRFRQQARPELCAQEERDLHEARYLELSTRDEDGAVWLSGLLDAEGGAYVRTAIEALAQPLPDDDRLAGQRRADALVEVAKLALDEGRVPQQGTVRPHVQVTATLESLLGQPGAAPAELEGSGPISLEMLRRMAGDCSLRRLLLDEESMVIDVGRERRVYRGATRLALEQRDKGCVWPGCSRSARFCQADHATPWWAGGETNVDDGRLLCRYHHRLRSDGWHLTKVVEDGETKWLVRPPISAIHSRGWAS